MGRSYSCSYSWCTIFVISLMMSSRFLVSEGVWLNLPSTGTKCVSEEIQNNVVVVADYVVIDEHGHAPPTVSAKVDFLLISFSTVVVLFLTI